MTSSEQFINIIGRDVVISNTLKDVMQQRDNNSEKVLITMDRFYDGIDFNQKNVNMVIRNPYYEEIIINLNSVKTVKDYTLEFDFLFTEEITKYQGWLDVIFVVTSTDGYKWQSKQVSRAMFVSSNFTYHEVPVPNEYYVDLEEYRIEILGYISRCVNEVDNAKKEATRSYTEANRSYTEANRSKTEADRAGAAAGEATASLVNKIDNKNKLDGVNQENFNFMTSDHPQMPNTVDKIETTDASGEKTTILSLGSTGDHVEMATGRTLEQEYLGVLKALGKEYVSTTGADITINNGVEARLIGAEIQGNTKRLDANGNECEAGTEGARLVSTEACISNNGSKYPLYMLDEEGNKKQILLNGGGSIKDVLRLNSDGSLSCENKIIERYVDGAAIRSVNTDLTNTVYITLTFNDGTINQSASNVFIMSKLYNRNEYIYNQDVVGVFIEGPSYSVRYRLPKSIVGTSIEEVKQYFNLNPDTIRYSIQIPNTITIPKEVNEPIASYDKINILGVGEAVKASSFSVNVPINRAAELDNRLSDLENVMRTTVLQGAYCDEEYSKTLKMIDKL